MDPGVIKLFLEQASAKGSKSTVLKPLYMMMAVCIAGVFTTFHFSFPLWSSYFFAFFTCMTMCVYLAAYVYCIFKHPDALRSESYSIQKLAIQKGFVGDDLTGVVHVTASSATNLIEESVGADSEAVR